MSVKAARVALVHEDGVRYLDRELWIVPPVGRQAVLKTVARIARGGSTPLLSAMTLSVAWIGGRVVMQCPAKA